MSSENTKNVGGRPSKYTQELGDEICRRLAEGQSLITICNSEHMPHRSTVLDWALGNVTAATNGGFPDKYALARQIQTEVFVDEAIPIADEMQGCSDSSAVQAARLRIDTRKWYASKLRPSLYGDKQSVEHTGKDGGPIETKGTVDVSHLSTETLRMIKRDMEGEDDG